MSSGGPIPPDRSNFLQVLEDVFGKDEWRQWNLFGVKLGGFGTAFLLEYNGINYCLKIQNS